MTKKLLLILSLIFLATSGLNCSRSSDKTGGVFKSGDNGETWQQKVFVSQEKKKQTTIATTNVTDLKLNPKNTQELYAVTQENGIYKSINGGDQWQPTGIATGSFSSLSIDPLQPEQLYAASSNSIYKSTNAGQNWEKIFVNVRLQKVTSVVVDIYDPKKVYASIEDGEVILSSDNGATWSVIYTTSDKISRLVIEPTDTRIIYLLTNNGLYKSLDSGNTFTNLKEKVKDYNKASNVQTLSVFGTTLFMGTEYGLLKSTDGGEHWEAIKTLIPFGKMAIKVLSVNPKNFNEILFATGKVIHKTTDGGNNWKTIETLATDRDINTIVFDPDNADVLYAGVLKPAKK